MVRAHGKANEGYALLDDDDAEEDADAALLASLSSREKRALLKRLAGDDDPDVSEAGFNALKAREERVRDDSSCAVDFGSQSTNMDLVEPADIVVDDEPASSSGAPS